MKALIFQNKVVDISEQEFEVSPEMQWIDAPENCEIGWQYNDQQLTAPTFNETRTYIENRAAAYPSLAEQMDMQYWDSVNGTTVWADTIAAIKAAHPKP
jgi:hypothetical protein